MVVNGGLKYESVKIKIVEVLRSPTSMSQYISYALVITYILDDGHILKGLHLVKPISVGGGVNLPLSNILK